MEVVATKLPLAINSRFFDTINNNVAGCGCKN